MLISAQPEIVHMKWLYNMGCLRKKQVVVPFIIPHKTLLAHGTAMDFRMSRIDSRDDDSKRCGVVGFVDVTCMMLLMSVRFKERNS